MAQIVASTHLPPLGGHERDEVGRQLQATLVELIDLSLVGKQLHWSVVGPNFRSLHLQLDELVDSWRDLSDTVAERAVAIGISPDGQASAIVEAAERSAITPGAILDHEVVSELIRRVAEASERTRTRAERIAELDLASQDVLVDVLRALEQQQWMLRAQIQGRA
ncbi:MAG: DNA starvation/stationary phase protection protein [Solirubrobacteraceae bacterium]|jgi:starvation-inducible DNA-binding protein